MPEPRARHFRTTAQIADLKRISLFADLPDEELASMAPSFSLRRHPRGAIVVSEGEDVSVVSFVVEGSVQLFWCDEDGRQVDVTRLRPGQHFMHAAMLDEPMAVSAMAAEPIVLATIGARDLQGLMLHSPAVAVRIARDLMIVARNLLERLRALSLEGVHGRVVWLLHRHARRQDDRLVSEPMTQPEIGRRVGATREMVGRVLRELVRDGYIEPHDGAYVIVRTPPRRGKRQS